MRIQIVQDIVCPWCRIGKVNLQTAIAQLPIERQLAIEIDWLPYQLDPVPAGEKPDFRERFTERKGVSPEAMTSMFDRVSEAGARVGLSFDFDRISVAVDTIPCHVAIAATPRSDQPVLIDALYAAYFEQGVDVGEPAAILNAAKAAGLGEPARDAIADALQDSQARLDTEAIVDQVRAAGITAVPFFIIDGKIGLSGAQPPDAFIAAFEEVREAVGSGH